MVAVTGIFCGYVVGTLWPNAMSASNPGTLFMMVVAVVFTFGVAYIAHRGVNGSTAVSIAINVIQISALMVFAVMAIGYRMNHPPGSVAFQFDSTSGEAYTYSLRRHRRRPTAQTTDDHRARRQHGAAADAGCRRQARAVHDQLSGRQTRWAISCPIPSGKSVVGMHNVGWMFVQATVAILILVGFESVTAMGGEAKNAKRDVPIAVITSLLVQGVFLLSVRVFRGELLLK